VGAGETAVDCEDDERGVNRSDLIQAGTALRAQRVKPVDDGI